MWVLPCEGLPWICGGGRVRIKRTSRGMSQQELCELLGVSRNDLVAFEAGAKRINANRRFRIATSLNVQPDSSEVTSEQPRAN
jgi:transcriptional regulator with XRE-family HTH domain